LVIGGHGQLINEFIHYLMEGNKGVLKAGGEWGRDFGGKKRGYFYLIYT